MADTVGAARRAGDGAKAAAAALALGLVVSSASTLAAIGAAGRLLPSNHIVLVTIAAVCLVAAAGDLAGRRVRPQIRLQVPERWRRTMPLPVASLLYGLLLGTGFSSAVPAFALWGLLLVVAALGSMTGALVVGLVLGLGRALPIVLGVPLAERADLFRVVRIAGACALASAALAGPAGAAIPAPSTDPSAAGGDTAWEQPGVGGFLRLADGTESQLAGDDPAIGGALVAWHVGATVTVADRATLQPRFEEQIVGIRQLAISDAWLVLRVALADGSRLLAQSLADTSVHRVVAQTRWPAVIGRPAISGTVVVYATSTARGSSITAVDLPSGSTRRVRNSRTSLLVNPSLLGGALLYDDVSRCAQLLRLGPLDGSGGRVLYTLPPLAGQDAGHELGYSTEGQRTPCPGRIRPTTRMLWTTALDDNAAYVTTLTEPSAGTTHPTIVRIGRHPRARAAQHHSG